MHLSDKLQVFMRGFGYVDSSLSSNDALQTLDLHGLKFKGRIALQIGGHSKLPLGSNSKTPNPRILWSPRLEQLSLWDPVSQVNSLETNVFMKFLIVFSNLNMQFVLKLEISQWPWKLPDRWTGTSSYSGGQQADILQNQGQIKMVSHKIGWMSYARLFHVCLAKLMKDQPTLSCWDR